jgi:hypothetical protein
MFTRFPSTHSRPETDDGRAPLKLRFACFAASLFCTTMMFAPIVDKAAKMAAMA